MINKKLIKIFSLVRMINQYLISLRTVNRFGQVTNFLFVFTKKFYPKNLLFFFSHIERNMVMLALVRAVALKFVWAFVLSRNCSHSSKYHLCFHSKAREKGQERQ